jgi:hypothetical protein
MSRQVIAVCAMAAALAMSNAARAEESELSASLDLPVLSAYVWRGQVLNDEAVVQPSLTVSKGGFAINWWANYNLTDEVTGDANEFSEHDISVSYSGTCPLTGADMTLGIVNYDFPNQSTVTAEGNAALVADTRELYLIAAFSAVPLAPTLSVYYDFKEADGFYGSLGISHSVELTDKASLSLAAALGAADKDWATFYYPDVKEQDAGLTDWNVSASVPITLCDSLTLTPGVTYAALIGDAKDTVDNTGIYYGDTDQVIGSLKATYAF